MAFGDKLKDLAKQAQEAVAERKDQIAGAVDRASVMADQRTGGKYSDKIAKAGQKATGVVEKIAGDSDASGQAPAPDPDAGPADPPAGHAPGTPAPGTPAEPPAGPPPDFQ